MRKTPVPVRAASRGTGKSPASRAPAATTVKSKAAPVVKGGTAVRLAGAVRTQAQTLSPTVRASAPVPTSQTRKPPHPPLPVWPD